ncbi:MAG: SH3 domain-containing protein, partial [Fimbriimonadales bacterium]
MNLRVTLAAAVATASVVAIGQSYSIQEADGLGGKSAKTGSEAATTGKLHLAPISTAKVGINGEGVLIYKSPDSSSPTLAAVGRGKVAWVKARFGDWYKLKFPSGTVGYVKREFLTGIPLVQPTSARSAYIIRNAVVVRRGASTKTGRTGTAGRGEEGRDLGKGGGWCRAGFAR